MALISGLTPAAGNTDHMAREYSVSQRDVVLPSSEALLAFDFDEAIIAESKREDGTPFNYVGSEFGDRDPSGGMTSADVEIAVRGIASAMKSILARALEETSED